VEESSDDVEESLDDVKESLDVVVALQSRGFGSKSVVEESLHVVLLSEFVRADSPHDRLELRA